MIIPLLLAACSERAGNSAEEVRPPEAFLRIDGSFEDWSVVREAIDDSGDAPGSELDLGKISVSSDDAHIYLRIGFDRELNLQRLDGTLRLLLDGDGNSATGREEQGLRGVDLVVEFSPDDPLNPERPHMGVGVSLNGSGSTGGGMSKPSDLGFRLGPAYAAGEVECRWDRGVSGLFEGDSMRLKLVLVDDGGRVADETGVISHALVAGRVGGVVVRGVDGVPERGAGGVRVMTWNVENGNLLKVADLSARVLRAIDPDVVLFQELSSRNSGLVLERFLNERVAGTGDRWRVVFGEGGGALRCAIASRLPVEPVVSLGLVSHPDRPGRQVRFVGAAVTMGGRRVLCGSMHLKCCGRLGSPEEESRLVEVRLINSALSGVLARGGYDAVVIGGDLNLVGGRGPLRKLGVGLGLDRADLQVLEPYHLDGRENATWADGSLPFVPARLDYLLISDGVLGAERSFVFDTADLSEGWLSARGLRAGDSALVSDHWPVVADLR